MVKLIGITIQSGSCRDGRPDKTAWRKNGENENGG